MTESTSMPPLPPPKPAVDPHARAFDCWPFAASRAELDLANAKLLRGAPLIELVDTLLFRACFGLRDYLSHNERRKAR